MNPFQKVGSGAHTASGACSRVGRNWAQSLALSADVLVSVVVPCYNHAEYLEAALWSVARQTLPRLELVILDDASRDNSAEIIRALVGRPDFSQRFESLQVIEHAQNFGANHTINEGVRHTSGEFIALLNSDDLYGDAARLEKMLLGCIQNTSRIAFSQVALIDTNGNPWRDNGSEGSPSAYFFEHQDLANRAYTVGEAVIQCNTAISTGNLMFARPLFNALSGFRDYPYVHDWDFLLRSLFFTEPAYVRNTTYQYRLHHSNTHYHLRQDDASIRRELARMMVGANDQLECMQVRNPLFNRQRFIEKMRDTLEWAK